MERPFTAAEAEPLLAALHVGVSFALGRWAAPMLPIGKGSTGEVVWEDWRPSHCDPARKISPGWWHQQQHTSLADFLGRVIKAFADPDRRPALRLQMMFGIAALNDRGFVEPRIMMGAAGLEHIMWQTLVLGGGMTEDQYRRAEAHHLLRIVLTDADPYRHRREPPAGDREVRGRGEGAPGKDPRRPGGGDAGS